MALRDLGADFEHYRVVEFDKFAINSYNSIHGTDFPTMDITKIKGVDLGIEDVERFTYLLTYSFPCFTGETMVLTNNGYKQIKDIKTTDKVLTHTNKYKRVTAHKMTGTKEIYSVKGMCIDEIRCTENHKFYARKMVRHYPTYPNGRRGKEREFLKPDWVECKNLDKTYYLGIAINQNQMLPEWNGITYEWSDGRKPRHKNNLAKYMNNSDFWWLIGRYVGDGWQRSQGGIIICCAKDEVEEITIVADRLKFNYSIANENTVNKIHFSDKELQEFVKPIGKGARHKCVPGFIIDLPRELVKAFVDGYVSADGCCTQGRYKTLSVSRTLSYGIAQCVAKAYRTPYSIYRILSNKKHNIQNRVVNQHDGFQVVWKTEKKKQDKAFYEDGYIWFPINEVSATGDMEEVYDIEVETDHSFTANGVIVHNCQDLSVAGKMRGMSKGDNTRSGLLWEVERLLNEVNNLPQILLMENVTQVHSEDNMPDFQTWIDFLTSKGYSNYWQDLNARDYGVAQNRNRCFMVSLLGEYNFKFPKTIPLDKNMKEYLEDAVEDKYYITSEKAQKLIDTLILDGKIPNGTERNGTERNGQQLISHLTAQELSTKQTAFAQDTIAESLTCKQTDAVLLSGMSSENRTPDIKQINVACTLCARDYKGLNNYGSNGVLECIKISDC